MNLSLNNKASQTTERAQWSWQVPPNSPSSTSISVSALSTPHTIPEHLPISCLLQSLQLHVLIDPTLFHVPIDRFLFHVSIDPLLWILNLLFQSTVHSWTWIGSFHTCLGFSLQITSMLFSLWTPSCIQSQKALFLHQIALKFYV